MYVWLDMCVRNNHTEYIFLDEVPKCKDQGVAGGREWLGHPGQQSQRFRKLGRKMNIFIGK
jgi:hypothetical protein